MAHCVSCTKVVINASATTAKKSLSGFWVNLKATVCWRRLCNYTNNKSHDAQLGHNSLPGDYDTFRLAFNLAKRERGREPDRVFQGLPIPMARESLRIWPTYDSKMCQLSGRQKGETKKLKTNGFWKKNWRGLIGNSSHYFRAMQTVFFLGATFAQKRRKLCQWTCGLPPQGVNLAGTL